MRRTPEEVRAEFHRLYDCFEAFEKALAPILSPEELAWRTPASRDEMIVWVDQKKATNSDICAGAREALNESAAILVEMMQYEPEKAQGLLSRYFDDTGRDFWQDAGHPKKQITAILKRGKIIDETEFRLINEYVIDQSQTLLTEKQIQACNALMGAFELA